MRHLNRPFPWRLCTAQWHVYIPRQRMPEDVGRLTPHVTSLSLVLSFSLPQLPPPAPLWKPPLMEPSLAQSTLLDMRSISLVPRATILSVLPRVSAGTMAPGPASVPSVKVSVFGSSVTFDSGEKSSFTSATVWFHHRIRSFSPPWLSPHTNIHPVLPIYDLVECFCAGTKTHLRQPWLSRVWMPGWKRWQPQRPNWVPRTYTDNRQRKEPFFGVVGAPQHTEWSPR